MTADVTTLTVDVGCCQSPKLEDSCWPGSRGSKPCRPGSSLQLSQPDMATDLAAQGLKVGPRTETAATEFRSSIKLYFHCTCHKYRAMKDSLHTVRNYEEIYTMVYDGYITWL